MVTSIVVIVFGVLFNVICFFVAGLVAIGKNKQPGMVVILVLLGILCTGFIFLGAFLIGTGMPARIMDISDNPIYTIQARLPYDNGIDGVVVVKKDAEKSDSGFLLVECKLEELPDVNLVRVKGNKFIPFSLYQKTQ